MEIETLPSPLPRISPKQVMIKSSDSSPLLLGSRTDFLGAGLTNVAYTCYLNSVLQCIIHTVPLVEKLDLSYHNHPDSGNTGDFCYLCALKKLSNSCMTSPLGVVTPFDFTRNLKKLSTGFSLGVQQDAHEYLVCLLNNLSECCSNHSFKDEPSSMDKNSLIEQVYGGSSISQLRCCECGHYSNSPDPFLALSLEISDANTLTDALESYAKVEKIEEAKFNCEGCKSEVLMETQTKIDQVPTVISLHLKRFMINGQVINKIDKFVEYPLELDLRPYTNCPKDEEQTIYELYAILVHLGNMSYGHYYSYIRSSPTTWHIMDDSRVNRVSETHVLDDLAYILFYIKKGSSLCFSSLMEAHDTSPISVLNNPMRGIFSPSSAEETNSSSSLESAEKEPGPCTYAFHESVNDQVKCDTSPATPRACDGTSHQRGPQNVLTSRLQSQATKRSSFDHFAINIDDVFPYENLEDEKENNSIYLQVNVGSKGNNQEGKKATVLEPVKCASHLSAPLKRLVKYMPSSRRAALLASLPPEEKNFVSKRSPLIFMTQPLGKKRRALLCDSNPVNGHEGNHQRPTKASSRSSSPHSIRRGLFGDDVQ